MLTKDMWKGAGGAALAALLLATAWGCASSKAPGLEQQELTQAEVDRFLDAGKDPRTWGVTVRRGPSGMEFEDANRPWLGKASRTPLWKGAGGMPVLVAESMAGDEFKALVDTSARQCWLAPPWTRELDWRVFKDSVGEPFGEWPDHATGKIPGYAGAGSKVVLNLLHVETPVFYVSPSRGMLGALARGREPWRKNVAAVLGAALLKKFSYVTLDFPGRRIAWASPETKPFAPGAGTEGMALGDWKGRPAVGVRLGGVEETAVVDTAGDFDVSLPAAALKGVKAAQEGRPVEMELVLGGRVTVPRVTVVTHESLGLPGDWPARVGWRVWRNYRMTLDWQHRKLWLTSPEMAEAAREEAAEKDGEAAGPVRYRGVAP